jgi:hypothetical protein
MNMSVRHALIGLVLLSLAGCAEPRPQEVNMEEYTFRTAINSCRQAVWDRAYDEPRSVRRKVFELCMNDYGYDDQSYRHLWIDVLD